MVAYPGLANGAVHIGLCNFFQGAEANVTYNLWEKGGQRLQLLAGFRYQNLDEELRIDEVGDFPADAPAGLPGRTFHVQDSFVTRNDFYGAQIGARGVLRHKRMLLEMIAKVALGSTESEVAVNGLTRISGDPVFFQNAGLLALASNSGRHQRSQFTAMPEAGVNLGLEVTEWLQLNFGYTFIYWDNVLRPGEQVDRALNPRLIPTSSTFGAPGGPARPAVLERDSDFWVHGLSFGVQLKF